MATALDTAHGEPPAAMLKVRGLGCERDERWLFRALDFSLGSGEVLRVTGRNGSGKTTLLRIVCGLYEGCEGAIEWCGEPVAGQVETFRAALVYLGHRIGVNKLLTPLQNLRWSGGLQRRVADDELYRALAATGLRGFEESPSFTLSAGQQQRVALARLWLDGGPLWVLDEPFSNLDGDGIGLLEARIRAHAGHGGAVLITTHHALQAPGLRTLELGECGR